MIISIAPMRPSRGRRAVVVLACAGVAALLAALLDIGTTSPSHVAAEPVRVAEPEIARAAPDDATRETPAAQEARSRIAEVARMVNAPAAQLPTMPFRFLGTLDAEGLPSVVLYGRGRTLTVRGPGPLDDEYVVDAIEERYLILRHVASGTSHMLELALRQHTTAPAGSGIDTAPD